MGVPSLWRAAAAAILLLVVYTLPTKAAEFEEILPGFLPTAVGVGWGDYDGDGYPDLFVPGNNQGDDPALEHGPYLFHNNHDLTFTDVSQSFGFDSVTVVEQDGVAWGDYDNDGDLDLLVGSARGTRCSTGGTGTSSWRSARLRAFM